MNMQGLQTTAVASSLAGDQQFHLLANSLAKLLETATRELDRDQKVAKASLALATQVQERIACGILYQREDIPDFYNRLIPRQGVETTCVEEVRRYDVSEYWKDLA